jgi:hypothetical protein
MAFMAFLVFFWKIMAFMGFAFFIAFMVFIGVAGTRLDRRIESTWYLSQNGYGSILIRTESVGAQRTLSFCVWVFVWRHSKEIEVSSM